MVINAKLMYNKLETEQNMQVEDINLGFGHSFGEVIVSMFAGSLTFEQTLRLAT